MSDLPMNMTDLLGVVSPGAVAMVIYYQRVPWARPDKLDQAVYGIIGTGAVALIAAFIESVFGWGVSLLGVEMPHFGLLGAGLRIGAGIGLGLLWASCFDGKLHRQLDCSENEAISSGPTAWHHAFRAMGSFVILHLQDGRRLQGWPKGWPGDSTKGHFLLTHTRWLEGGEAAAVLLPGHAVLMPVEKVSWVQFIPDPSDLRSADSSGAVNAAPPVHLKTYAHYL